MAAGDGQFAGAAAELSALPVMQAAKNVIEDLQQPTTPLLDYVDVLSVMQHLLHMTLDVVGYLCDEGEAGLPVSLWHWQRWC